MRSGVDALFWLRVTALLAWVAGCVAAAYLLVIYPRRAVTGSTRDFSFFVSDDDTVASLAQRLHAERVITEPAWFALYLRLRKLDAPLERGYVPLNRALSPRKLVPRLLQTGAQVAVRVTIPEGFNRFDVATRLSRFGIAKQHELLQASTDRSLLAELGISGPSAEGYLFPATYELLTRSRAQVVLRSMVQAYRRNTRPLFDRLAQARSLGTSLLTDEQALILASIVEKEARIAEERATIAGTFMNRLLEPSFVPHRLQADPTVAYGCLTMAERVPSCVSFDGRRVTPQMVRDPDNPYNTYRIEGLPPGPITNPGLASLEAAIVPEKHDYFYFVATGGGRHTFSHSLEQHNDAVSGAR